ncbi:diguanylate cyclase [Glaciecola sp. MF2-115]|uniref:sensor domain-containing diguanylate cyclase n=1 Tax=Glaciecola sp. MF2-115 TaxID=3384827 RepID=UPI0039A028BC
MAKRPNYDILQGLLLGVLAALANSFLSIPIYGALTLSWGMGLCIYVLISFGGRAALITLIITLASMYATGHSILSTGVHVAEFFIIALLIHKRFFVIIASLSFWLIIGGPFYWLFLTMAPSSGSGQEFSFIFASMQGLNGLFNGSLAAMLYLLTPTKWLSDDSSSANRSLSSNIFALSALTLILPLVTISLVLASTASERNEEQLMKILRSQTNTVSLTTERFIDEHFTLVKQLARALSRVSDEDARKNLLLDAQMDYPDFFNLTYIQEDGYTSFFAPRRFNDDLENLPRNLRYVNDRAYFKHARDTKTPFISGVMMSRGMISAPMIALSSPILIDGNFQGVLLGAMNLQFIANLQERMESTLNSDYLIITDAEDKVIYASPSTGLQSLSKFNLTVTESKFSPGFPMLSIEGRGHPYNMATNSFAWKIYVIKHPDELVELFSHHLLVLTMTVVLIILLFLLIAHKLAKRITSPLVKLLGNNSDNYIANFENELSATSSQEINEVASKLRKSHNLLRDFEDQLQQQVSEKTTQLEQMNLQLAAQAREDGLTHLLNRNGFDEIAYNAIKTNQRLQQPISLALIDIDHFKLINDSYGHIVGDECLKAFSALMQDNCKRETDIIGRYGGEEFVILMSSKDVRAHHQLIHNIHIQTQNMRIEVKDLKVPIRLTVSIGVCSLLGNSQLSLHEIINIADEELYKCKNNGRNQLSIVTIDPE